MVSIRICRKGPYCPDRAAKAASVRRYLISNSLGISVSFTFGRLLALPGGVKGRGRHQGRFPYYTSKNFPMQGASSDGKAGGDVIS